MREVPFNRIIIIFAIFILSLLLEGGLDEHLLFFAIISSLFLLLLALSCPASSFLDDTLFTSDLADTFVKISLFAIFLLEIHTREFSLELVDNIAVLEEIDLLAQFWILLDILDEHIVILLVALGGILGLTTLVLLALFITSVLLEVLEFPKSVLLSLAELGICLLDEDDWRYLDLFIVVHIVQLHQINSIKIITKDRIIVVKHLT